jgi:hypothetical protein
VLRNALGFVAVILVAVILVNVLHTSDREAVEDEMVRLIGLAREGGEDAVAGILDSFAEDYRGSGYYSRESIERRLRSHLVPAGRLTSLTHGSIDAIVKGSEIMIPTVSLKAEFGGDAMQVVVAVTWAKRGGAWKIVEVQRWKFGE